MSNKEQVDKDLREYLAKADNLRNEDKMSYLRALFDKHFTFTKLDHLVIKHDLFGILSTAKTNFTKQGIRPSISGKQVDQSELVHLAVIESFISYLNKNELLKRQVKFDYTDDSHEFESMEDL